MDKTDANTMINIEEIKNTIIELEKGETTFSSCEKLASLYIILEHTQNSPIEALQDTIKEYNDILPTYYNYRALKGQYQRNMVDKSAIQYSIKLVCKEIKEFIETLYSHTDMTEERQEIEQMIVDMQKIGK